MHSSLSCRVLLALGIAACSFTAAAGPTLERIRTSQTLTIGYRPGSAPMSYETNGQVTGYAVELCQRVGNAIAQQLKLPSLKIRYVPVTSAERIPALLKGNIDMECAGTTNTKSRREQVAFGLTYFYAGAALLVRDGEGIQGLMNMHGKTLAVVKGTTGQLVAEAREREGGGWKTVVFDNTRAAVEALEQGKADGVIQDDIQLVPLARKSSKKLVLAGRNLSIEPLAPMFNKNDPELTSLVQSFMRQFYRDGEMAQLYDRWFMHEVPGQGYNLSLKLNPLLSDNFRRPSSYVTDWVML